jgi:ribonuclease Y
MLLATLAGAGVGLLLGAAGYWALHRTRLTRARETSRSVLESAHSDATAVRKEAELLAKEYLCERQLQTEEELRQRRSEWRRAEEWLREREEGLAQRQVHLDRRERDYENLAKKQHARERMLKAQDEALRAREEELRARLAEVGQLSVEDARRQLVAQIAVEARHEAAQWARRADAEMKEMLEHRARWALATAIERCAADFVSETTVTTVPLPNDDMKGRVIGREGRNIRAFEVLTGVDLIVDDVPEAILISSFDPMRRDIARRALEALVLDGRIHPARIEQMVAKARDELEQNALADARSLAESLRVGHVPDEVLAMLARLRYRTSFGQNVLQHSKEVAIIASSLAAEIGANASVARRAGFLHDLGKAADRFVEGDHVEIGLRALRQCGESSEVLHAIEAHHGTVEPRTVVAVLLQIADKVSASRPGARRDALDAYVRRIRHLEEIAESLAGVGRAFAIHAGRELRVIVEADKVSDDDTYLIAKDIVRRIQGEVQFPGPIQVTVIRETRAMASA